MGNNTCVTEDKISGPYFSMTYDSDLKGIDILILNVEEDNKKKALDELMEYLKNVYENGKYKDSVRLEDTRIVFDDSLTDDEKFEIIDNITDYKPESTSSATVTESKLDEDTGYTQWDELTDIEQTAANMAQDWIRSNGVDIEDGVRYACGEVSDANYKLDSGADYEEPNFDKVLSYVQGNMIKNEIVTENIETPELRIDLPPLSLKDECTNPSSIPNAPAKHKTVNKNNKADNDDELELREDWEEIRPRERKSDTYYNYNYYVDDCGGLGFPCDEEGNIDVDSMNDGMRKNYEYAIAHPEKYPNKFIQKYTNNYTEPALVKCSNCGEEFEAVADSWGEVECPECGQLYNAFGQELARRGRDVDYMDASEYVYDDMYYESLQLKEDYFEDGPCGPAFGNAGPGMWYDEETNEYYSDDFINSPEFSRYYGRDLDEFNYDYYDDELEESLQLKEAEDDKEPDTTFGDPTDIPLTGDVDKDFKTVINYLRDQSYSELGDALDKICDDKKLYTLLSKGFGDGELANVKMSSGTTTIAAAQLLPSQSEIGLDNSLAYPLKSDCHSYFDDAVTIVAPIITYRKTFIIDGHHRWSQALMINPNVKMNAINFDYTEQSPYRALRNFQGAIAVTNKEVPSQDTKVHNVYAMSEQEIRKYVEDNIQDVCVNSLIDVGVAKDKDGVIDYIVNNAMQLKSNNPPFADAPDRKYMPQTDTASIKTAAQGQTNI